MDYFPELGAPKEVVRGKATDPLVRGLLWGTLGALFLAIVLFVGFKFLLISGASGLHAIAPLTSP